jgi:hypothetical protein
VANGAPARLELVQPSGWRRDWQLLRDGEVRGRLRMPAFRGAVEGEAAGRTVRIERGGRSRSDRVVRDALTGETVATLRRDGRRLLLEQPDRVCEWKRLEDRRWHGFVDPAAGAIVRARIHSGLARTSGEVEIDTSVREEDALVAALLACFVLIRKRDEDVAVVAAVA